MSREDSVFAGLMFRVQLMELQKVLARLMQSEKSFLSIETLSVSPLSFDCLVFILGSSEDQVTDCTMTKKKPDGKRKGQTWVFFTASDA